MNAAEATIDVSGVDLLALTAQANAGQLRVVAEDATLVDLDVSANAASVVMVLGGDTSGSVSANAGSIDVCVPDDAALRIEVEEQFAFGTNLDGQGLERVGDTWRRSGTGPTIELRVEGTRRASTSIQQELSMNGRLYRSRRERMLAGVAGGLAEQWNVDPSLVRLVWALLVPPHRRAGAGRLHRDGDRRAEAGSAAADGAELDASPLATRE